jgi:hypothetical protein
MPERPKKLLDPVREAVQRRHYSLGRRRAIGHVLNRGGLAVRSPLD